MKLNVLGDAVKNVINKSTAVKNYVNSNPSVKAAVNKATGGTSSGTTKRLKADPEGTVIKDNTGSDVGISYNSTPTWLSGELKTSRDQSTVRSGANNIINTNGYTGATGSLEGTENDYINRIADLQKAAKNAEYANAYNKVLSQLDESRAKTRAEYRNQMNSADVANQLNLKNYFENVANRGQTYSGSTSQGELALRIAGMNNQSTLANSRAQALANLDREEVRAYNDYVTNMATSDATIEAQKYQNLLEQLRTDQERLRKEEKEAFEREIKTISQYYQDYTAEIQRREALDPNDKLIPYLKIARQEKIDALEKKAKEDLETLEKQQQQEFNNLIKLNDFAGLRALGYDTTNLERDYNLSVANTQSQIAKRYSSGSKSSSGGSKTTKTTTDNTYKSSNNSIAAYINGRLKEDLIKYDKDTKTYGLADSLEYDAQTNLTKKQVYNWYKDPIIQETLVGVYDGTLTPNEAESFLLDLGYSKSDMERVANYTFKK